MRTLCATESENGTRGFTESYAPVEDSGKWGYITTDGSWLVEPKFDTARLFFPGGFAEVLLDGKKGFIDREGKWHDELPL